MIWYKLSDGTLPAQTDENNKCSDIVIVWDRDEPEWPKLGYFQYKDGKKLEWDFMYEDDLWYYDLSDFDRFCCWAEIEAPGGMEDEDLQN